MIEDKSSSVCDFSLTLEEMNKIKEDYDKEIEKGKQIETEKKRINTEIGEEQLKLKEKLQQIEGLQKKLQENTNESNSLKQNYKEVQEEKKQSMLKKHELETDIKRLEKELVNSRNEIS